MSTHMSEITLPDALPNGVIPVSYIGVNGVPYRVRVAVRSILLEQLEGSVDFHPKNGFGQLPKQTFSTFHDANWQLMTRRKTAPKGGGYLKHRYTVTWANGFEYTGHFDLEHNDSWPSIEDNIRRTLKWMLEADASYITTKQRDQASYMLEFLAIGQHYPSHAPDDWIVVRDYSNTQKAKDEIPIEIAVYAMGEDHADQI